MEVPAQPTVDAVDAPEPTRTARERKRTLWSFRIAAGLLIGFGIAWLVGVGPLALFFATFGDCFENCDGYFGVWAERARYGNLVVPLGQITFAVAVAALVFRLAQVALAVIAAVMLATLAIGAVVDLWGVVIPAADVYAGRFGSTFLFLIPAALFWLFGAALGLAASRLAGDARRPSPISRTDPA